MEPMGHLDERSDRPVLEPTSTDEAPSTEDLSDRDQAILAELASHGAGWTAFQGLRRSLDIHQMSLTRALNRLEEAGLVDRGDAGYRITDVGAQAVVDRPSEHGRGPMLTMVQALLPPNVGPSAVRERLSGRWFKGLRWYGEASGPGEVTLMWLAEPDNSLVRVRATSGSVVLETEVRRGRANASVAAARALFESLSGLYDLPVGGADEISWCMDSSCCAM